MKKDKNANIKRVRLTLARETVVNLTSDMLKDIAGGAIPLTRSACDSRCAGC